MAHRHRRAIAAANAIPKEQGKRHERCHNPSAPSSLQASLSALDQARIQADLTRLCDAVFAGRRIRTDGHDRAAAWLSETMSNRGLVLEPFDFTLQIPVPDLPTPPTFAVLDAAGTVRENLAHRCAFTEHPASADCPPPLTGVAQRWSAEGHLSKRVVTATPIMLPVVSVHVELLPTLDAAPVQAHIPPSRVKLL